MLKHIKYIASLSVAVFYALQLCFVFSGALVENIQQIRHQNQINKTLFAERKELSLQDWQLLDDRKEIKIGTVFYDVISYKINHAKVLVTVVEDSFESDLRITFQNLFNKKNIPNSNKKKSFNSYNYLTLFEKNKNIFLCSFPDAISKPNLVPSQIKTNKITTAIFRPPC